MKAGAHLIERGKIRDAAHVGDPARVHDRRADIVDQLFADQVLAVPAWFRNHGHRSYRLRPVAADSALYTATCSYSSSARKPMTCGAVSRMAATLAAVITASTAT